MKSRISNSTIAAMYKAAESNQVNRAYCKREQLLKLLPSFNEGNGLVSLEDIIPRDLPEDVAWDYLNEVVVGYLDEWCDNSYVSRWTNFGTDLYFDWERLVSMLKWS